MTENPKRYANPQLLIAPAQLATVLENALGGGAEVPHLLDLRPAETFAAGHIPGAYHIDLFGVSLIDTDPAPLKAYMWMISHLFASRGVSAQRPIVVYDEQSGIRASRAFWFLEYLGHPEARVLDGGFTAWRHGGHPVTTDAQAPTASGWCVERLDRERIATWRDVSDRLGRPGTVMLDTPPRFARTVVP